MTLSMSDIGWIVLTVAIIGNVMGAIPDAEPFDVVAWPPQPAPQPPEEIGSVNVESVDKPSAEPRSVTVEAAGACSDGSCGVQRRGLFNGLFRRGR